MLSAKAVDTASVSAAARCACIGDITVQILNDWRRLGNSKWHTCTI